MAINWMKLWKRGKNRTHSNPRNGVLAEQDDDEPRIIHCNRPGNFRCDASLSLSLWHPCSYHWSLRAPRVLYVQQS